jgi:hypothetical protein
MAQESEAFRYEFQLGLPVEGAEPGTNLLVSGPSAEVARELALDLLTAAPSDESLLLLSADVGGRELLDRLDDSPRLVDRSRLGVVDCAGMGDGEDRRFATHGDPISHPGDLTSIEVEFSLLYEKLAASNPRGVRVGLFSLSALLAHAPLREVSRFVHMLTGRVIATDDLGVFVVDAAREPPETVETMSHFCDRHIRVRRGEDGLELRVERRAGEADGWTAVDYDVGGLGWGDDAAER